MARVLCAALLGAAALATPASAAPGVGVEPVVSTSNGVGVGFRYTTNGGQSWQPGGAVRYKADTNQVCAGFSYQMPQCTPAIGPIE